MSILFTELHRIAKTRVHYLHTSFYLEHSFNVEKANLYSGIKSDKDVINQCLSGRHVLQRKEIFTDQCNITYFC
jgi:hypothetical protein